MDVIPASEVIENRNEKKMYLAVDKICIDCGGIITIYKNPGCLLCDNDINARNLCIHKDFIDGETSRTVRILLDFHISELRSLCEIHGCSMGTRARMVLHVLRKLDPRSDSRVDEELIRKVIIRNRRKFWYWRSIDSAMKIAQSKKSELKSTQGVCKIEIIKEEDIVEIGNKNRK